MGYVVYDRKTTAIASKVYKTNSAAQVQLKRMRNAAAGEWGVAETSVLLKRRTTMKTVTQVT